MFNKEYNLTFVGEIKFTIGRGLRFEDSCKVGFLLLPWDPTCLLSLSSTSKWSLGRLLLLCLNQLRLLLLLLLRLRYLFNHAHTSERPCRLAARVRSLGQILLKVGRRMGKTTIVKATRMRRVLERLIRYLRLFGFFLLSDFLLNTRLVINGRCGFIERDVRYVETTRQNGKVRSATLTNDCAAFTFFISKAELMI